jgi:hypothetical protein
MKVYDFTLRLAVSESVDESALLGRVRAFAAECGADPFAEPALRAEAKVVLTGVHTYGDDPVESRVWSRKACETLDKMGPGDVFVDRR